MFVFCVKNHAVSSFIGIYEEMGRYEIGLFAVDTKFHNLFLPIRKARIFGLFAFLYFLIIIAYNAGFLKRLRKNSSVFLKIAQVHRIGTQKTALNIH